MIRLNLTQRIWFSFISILLMVALLIGVIYPISLKSTLTEETYRIIEQEQNRFANPEGEYFAPPQTELDFIERRDAERSVFHFFLMNQFGTIEGDPVPSEVLQEMGDRAQNQMTRRGRYELTYNDAALFYVVYKVYTTGGEMYHISYMWDTYRDQMVNRLWGRLSYIMLFASLMSLVPAFWLKHYLKSPLTSLGNHFEQIAERNWKEPFHWEGDDDFEKLSNQFEKMRQNLIKYDSAQKTFIQHASHELKTPIMVVKSYAQSVKDGILPKENIENTMDVILEESNRMEKRVKDMLYYTKLESLKEAPMEMREFPFGSIGYHVGERFRLAREDVDIVVNGDQVMIYGDKEQLRVLLENLVENALRYAVSTIELNARDLGDYHVAIDVENNGDPIPEEEVEHVFTPFRKGNKGQFGLGLAIVKRICELHGGYPQVRNDDKGVIFTMVLPRTKLVDNQGKI
ncbi:HAMP domain-containing histidine kinase [Salipaludibacillus agaradhaerens]|uniref:sensor histidine kinase n=1 Tax=Salipaludibacillus agaradhaerens TaxID=76935 RepID=UPI00215183CE|nr:HAMP domain-containing sensor histidine kinase [Salipaludibacillus agaradhaerens]MCR6106149.1 HAMP domain-containing histidine kinase [Salipaludibacillus agaradhaerens]MCR6118182.1 HAMP domain-containing histidine kinase [Salipaludibacillus agaradhaerens]UJW57302.1 HAMP domain-containing histidine kinase [Bacillus sp. A116_S68]